MKKIMYVHHSDANCGSQRSLRFLVERIDKQEYEPTVLFFKDPECGKQFSQAGAKILQDARIRPFHGSIVSGMTARLFVANRFWTPRNYWLAKKYIRQVKPDIVHLNSTCLFQFAKAAKKVDKDIKVVCHIREPLLPNYHGDVLKKKCNKYVDRFISIDKYDATTVDEQMKKTDVVYNFVNFESYNASVQSDVLRRELHIPQEDVIFLYLARFAECNGTLEMVKACSKIRNKKYHFVFVGEQYNGQSTYENSVRTAAAGQEQIYLLPFRKDVTDVIASSDVMVCPFTQPHFSRAIIEAAAMGKPSIASDIEGVNELVLPGETGLMFDYNNFDSIIAAVEQLGADKELRDRMGKNAERFALENFNAEKNIKLTTDVYERVLK